MPTPIEFERGDKVRIADGPYRGFEGLVEGVDAGRMHVILPVFGRPTPVELEYYQVERG